MSVHRPGSGSRGRSTAAGGSLPARRTPQAAAFAVRRVAAGRRLDGEAAERVIFALVAQRALEPGSKLAATRWVAERVAVEGCAGFSEDAAYAAMGFLLMRALDEIASQIFGSVRAPAQPGPGHCLRRHHLHLVGAPQPAGQTSTAHRHDRISGRVAMVSDHW